MLSNHVGTNNGTAESAAKLTPAQLEALNVVKGHQVDAMQDLLTPEYIAPLRAEWLAAGDYEGEMPTAADFEDLVFKGLVQLTGVYTLTPTGAALVGYPEGKTMYPEWSDTATPKQAQNMVKMMEAFARGQGEARIGALDRAWSRPLHNDDVDSYLTPLNAMVANVFAELISGLYIKSEWMYGECGENTSEILYAIRRGIARELRSASTEELITLKRLYPYVGKNQPDVDEPTPPNAELTSEERAHKLETIATLYDASTPEERAAFWGDVARTRPDLYEAAIALAIQEAYTADDQP